MSDPAQFESALDRLATALKDVFRELRVEVPVAAPASETAPTAEAAPPPPPPEPVIVHVPVPTPMGPGTGPLCSGFDGILKAANQADIMQALLDGTAQYAGRSAVLVVKGDRLAGWRGRGFTDAGLAGLRGINLAADGDAGWRDSLGQEGPLPKEVADGFARNLGPSSEPNAYLIPLSVRERPVAVLYADSGADAAALRLLTRTAGIRLEILSGGAGRSTQPVPIVTPAQLAAHPPAAPPPAPVAHPSAPAAHPVAAPVAPPAAPVHAAPVAAAPPSAPPLAPVAAPPLEAPPVAAPPPPPPPPPPPAPRKPAGPDLTNVPPEEHDAHKKAFRFAKLLVDELMLYNKDKVAQGKQNRDVYAVLHEDIDKSRLAYEKKFASTPASKVDYFHQQMVAQIGNGDPAAIGNGYPGPLV